MQSALCRSSVCSPYQDSVAGYCRATRLDYEYTNYTISLAQIDQLLAPATSMLNQLQYSVGRPVLETFSFTASLVTLPRTTTFLLARSTSTFSTPAPAMGRVDSVEDSCGAMC